VARSFVRVGRDPLEHVKFHFDPLCPWCYQTSRWARRLEELGEIELEWGVFSLEVVNLEEGKDRRELEARSAPALRTAIMIRDSLGAKAIGPFYAALGRRIWEAPPLPDDPVVAVRDALDEAGLDPGLCDKALADEQSWDAVLAEHDALVEHAGSFGVPTMVLDAGTGPAIFGPVISVLPSDEDAVMLWRHTVGLMRYGNFSELKRPRALPPDLPTATWYREQREQKQADS
jgi:protein-disulfide isomerase-like protein with CxxC motif